MKCKRVILILLVLMLVAGIVGSSALAAPKKEDGSKKAEQTLLDPFTLRTVSVSSVSETMLTRQAIRVPMRPEPRSAFRPVW